MRRSRAALGGFPLACLVSFTLACPLSFIGLARPAEAAGIEAYGEYEALSDVAISPKGDKLVLATATSETSRTMAVLSVADGHIIGGINFGDQKLRGLSWADDDHVLITLSETARPIDLDGPRQEWNLSESYDVTDNKQRPLLQNVDNAMNVTYGKLEPRSVDGHTIVYVVGQYFPSVKGIPALYAIDLTENRTRLIEANSPNADRWIVDDKGNVVAEADTDENSQHWSLKLKRDGRWQEIYGEDTPIDSPELLGVSADGGSVLVVSTGGTGYRLLAFSLADGKPTDAKLPDGSGDTVVDPATHRIIGLAREDMDYKYEFMANDDKVRWQQVSQAFLGEQVELVSWSEDKKKVVVRVTGPRDGVAYELVDLSTMQSEVIGPVYKDIKPDDIAPVQAISYKAEDGTEIPAYLTLPKGREAKNLPLIVLPHGGPAARDEPGFDYWAQALASRGYAVLQPQFRGSDGFGFEFLKIGYGEFGRKMQTDLSDGVRYLASQGTIDAKRVCIVGASYGGYAALAGPTLDPGVYRCAVSVSGISDPREFVKWDASRLGGGDKGSMAYWDRYMGMKDSDDPAFDEIAPIKHIDKVTVPILLIHGKDDTVVPISQSADMADALSDAKKDVQFVKLTGEDHWLSRAETRTQMLNAMVGFLEKNNPP